MVLAGENKKLDKAQAGGKSNLIAFLFLLLMVLGIAFFVYLKSQNIDIRTVNLRELLNSKLVFKFQETPSNSRNIRIDFDEKEGSVFTVYKDYLVKCTRDGVRALDKNGAEQWLIPFSMNVPRLKENGSELLVYDMGGREIYVINGKNIKWNKKINNAIINAEISDGGYVSVVQEAKGYKGSVTVFNLQGNEFFTRSVAENYVLFSKVSDTGKYVVNSMVDTSGVQAVTSIEFTDMVGKPFAAKIPKADEVFPSLWFLKDDYFVAVSNSTVVCFDRYGKEKWKQEYAKNRIYSSNVCLGKYVLLAVSGEDKSGFFGNPAADIIVLNLEGKQSAAYTVQDKVINIKTYGDLAAVNTGREIHFINVKGKLIGKYSSKTDINDVHFFNKREAAVITRNCVIITEIGP